MTIPARKPGELPPGKPITQLDDDDDDPPNPDPIPQPVRKPNEERRAHQAPRSITCGFCESEITTMEGAVVKMSKRSRELRDAGELIEAMKAKIADLEEKLKELKSRLEPPPPEKKKNWWD